MSWFERALLGLGLMAAFGVGPVVAQSGGDAEEPEVGPALPPGSNPVLVDRIVAVVDEEPILLSYLEREIESYRFEAEAYLQNAVKMLGPDDRRPIQALKSLDGLKK